MLDLHRLMSPTLDNKESNQLVSSVFSTSCAIAKFQKLDVLEFLIQLRLHEDIKVAILGMIPQTCAAV